MIQGKKLLLARFLSRTPALRIGQWLDSGSLIIFNYHRIRSNDPGFATPFDPEVFGPSETEFDQQVAWLVRNTRVLSEAEVIAHVEARSPFPPRSVLITFDDGYVDNYSLAYPILRRHGASAIFFIPANPIERRELGWWDVIAYLVRKTRRSSIEIGNVPIPLQGDRSDVITLLLRRMKLEPAEKTRTLLAELLESCEVALPSGPEQDRELMSWDQIREVHRNDVAIGSHSHTHRVLATLDGPTQREELILSKRILEEKLGAEVRSIAYPVGGYAHFTEETKRLARECGYRAGFSFCTGVNDRRSVAPFDLRRIPAPREPELLSAMASLPRIFAAGRR